MPDARVYALAPRSQALLEAVGAWPLLAAHPGGGGPAPFHDMQVWEELGDGYVRLGEAPPSWGEEAAAAPLGQIVEDRLLHVAVNWT